MVFSPAGTSGAPAPDPCPTRKDYPCPAGHPNPASPWAPSSQTATKPKPTGGRERAATRSPPPRKSPVCPLRPSPLLAALCGHTAESSPKSNGNGHLNSLGPPSVKPVGPLGPPHSRIGSCIADFQCQKGALSWGLCLGASVFQPELPRFPQHPLSCPPALIWPLCSHLSAPGHCSSRATRMSPTLARLHTLPTVPGLWPTRSRPEACESSRLEGRHPSLGDRCCCNQELSRALGCGAGDPQQLGEPHSWTVKDQQ